MKIEDSTAINVREYLRLVYHVTDEQIREALADDDNAAVLRNGISLRSHNDYVGDEIAGRCGWEFDEEAYDTHYPEYDEDEW